MCVFDLRWSIFVCMNFFKYIFFPIYSWSICEQILFSWSALEIPTYTFTYFIIGTVSDWNKWSDSGLIAIADNCDFVKNIETVSTSLDLEGYVIVSVERRFPALSCLKIFFGFQIWKWIYYWLLTLQEYFTNHINCHFVLSPVYTWHLIIHPCKNLNDVIMTSL